MRALTLILLCLGSAGCATRVCGEGTEEKFNAEQNVVTCTAKIARAGVQCDPTTTTLVGGMCVAKLRCGAGTALDEGTTSCVPMMGSCGPVPKPCPPKGPSRFALAGTLSHLRDGKFSTGEMVEVRAYNPIQFLLASSDADRAKALLGSVTTADATYCLDDLPSPGGNLVAIAVTDPMGPKAWALAGVGLDNIELGKSYRLDGVIVEKDLVATWNKQAGLADGTFEASGAYVARFIDKPRDNEAGAKPVAAAKLQRDGADAPDTFYFKGDLVTIDKAQGMTDAATGAAVHKTIKGALANFGGKGGAINGAPVKWEVFPGGSTAGVVFVQKFHPTM